MYLKIKQYNIINELRGIYILAQFKTYDSIIENLQERIKYLEYKELIFNKYIEMTDEFSEFVEKLKL